MVKFLKAGTEKAEEIEKLAASSPYVEQYWRVDPDGTTIHTVFLHDPGVWPPDEYQIVDRPPAAPGSPDLSHVHRSVRTRRS